MASVEASFDDWDPRNEISRVKRLLGRNFDAVAEDIKRLSCEAIRGDDGSVLFHCPALDRSIQPEEVCPCPECHISWTDVGSTRYRPQFYGRYSDLHRQYTLKHLTVISIPSHFEIKQRAATVTAAGMAGIHHVSLLQEPIAAALAHGLGRRDDQDVILVADVGGGTFDVSIVSSFEGILEVVAYAGNQHLGGCDFDQAVADWILTEMNISTIDPETKAELYQVAEAVKIEVICNGRSSFTFNGCTSTLDIDEFNEITSHLTDQFKHPILEVGKAAQIDWIISDDTSFACQEHADPFRPPPRRITQVVLAGGSSPLPGLQSLIRNLTGLQPVKSKVDPKLCVALGASVFAGMLEGSIDGVEIMDGAYSQELHERISGFPTT